MLWWESPTGDVIKELGDKPYIDLEGGENLGSGELELVVETKGLVLAILKKVWKGGIKNSPVNLWETARFAAGLETGAKLVLETYERVVAAIRKNGTLEYDAMTLGIKITGNTVSFDFTKLDARVMHSIEQTSQKGMGAIVHLHPDLRANKEA